MSDQSMESISELKAIISRIQNYMDGELTQKDFESLLVISRNPHIYSEYFNKNDFLVKIAELSFTKSPNNENLNPEALKVLINIATNEGSSRCAFVNAISSKLFELLELDNLTEEEMFLLCRVLFLLSVDIEGSNLLSSSAACEAFVTNTLSGSFDSDSSLSGKIVIDLLRFRYNQVKNSCFNPERAVQEATGILLKCKIKEDFVNIIGSSINLHLGQGPENISFSVDFDLYLGILLFLIQLFVQSVNKDYLASALIVAVQMSCSDGRSRRQFRKKLLPSEDNNNIENLKQLLMSTDTSVSFLTGELLLNICKDNVPRFTRHLGFESCAGYLYRKGLLKNVALPSEEVIDPNGESSDEEYFLANPQVLTNNHTPLIPETEEEELELEYLMNKISDYNSKSQGK